MHLELEPELEGRWVGRGPAGRIILDSVDIL